MVQKAINWYILVGKYHSVPSVPPIFSVGVISSTIVTCACTLLHEGEEQPCVPNLVTTGLNRDAITSKTCVTEISVRNYELKLSF